RELGESGGGGALAREIAVVLDLDLRGEDRVDIRLSHSRSIEQRSQRNTRPLGNDSDALAFRQHRASRGERPARLVGRDGRLARELERCLLSFESSLSGAQLDVGEQTESLGEGQEPAQGVVLTQ